MWSINKFNNIKIGDNVDFNPILTKKMNNIDIGIDFSKYTGWRYGKIKEIDGRHVNVEFNNDNLVKCEFWTHLDNINEIAPFNTKCIYSNKNENDSEFEENSIDNENIDSNNDIDDYYIIIIIIVVILIAVVTVITVMTAITVITVMTMMTLIILMNSLKRN